MNKPIKKLFNWLRVTSYEDLKLVYQDLYGKDWEYKMKMQTSYWEDFVLYIKEKLC